jgi:glycosyltransferase involved in cell wall biosynthesis
MTTMTDPLRITFLLPMSAAKPAGGFKVVYEYANFLAARGHKINVVHPNLLRIEEPLSSFGLRTRIKIRARYFWMKWTRRYCPDHWFTVSPSVGMLWTETLAPENVPDADIVVATAWETAEWAVTYPSSKGRRFYIIQHLETWSGPEQRVFDTWRMPLEKIVIAGWLQRVATEMDEGTHLIPNGMDFTHFKQTVPSEDRDPHQLLMLYHIVKWKGSADGLAAFELARKMIPKLSLTLFGIDPAPANLPPGVKYHHQPPQDALNGFYNQAAIFISPSWTEGWGLPPAEALMCGGAIAVTRGGADEAFAIHNETALVSPIKDPLALAENIVRLVRDRDLRLRLAKRGHELIQQFTWERSGAALEALMLDAVAAPKAEPLNAEIVTLAWM